MKTLFSLIGMLALFVCLNWSGLAQDQLPQSPSAERQEPVDASTARAFEGKIMKAAGKCVLQESSTQQSYQLDNQAKAKHYLGKDVKVTATMDSRTNTLHVIDVTPVQR